LDEQNRKGDPKQKTQSPTSPAGEVEGGQKPGRPTDYRPKFAGQAEKLCLLGATDKDLADFFEVSESTLNLWKQKYPKFSESVKKGKVLADSHVAERLYQRALGYTCDDVHISNYQGDITITPIKKHYPPDTTAGIFWLKNRQRKNWRDIKAQSPPVSVPIQAADEAGRAEAVFLAMARGEISPDAANGILQALGTLLKAKELTEIERRMTALEKGGTAE